MFKFLFCFLNFYPGWFWSVLAVLFTQKSFHTSLILMANATTATEDKHSALPSSAAQKLSYTWLHRSILLNKTLKLFPQGTIICLLCRSKWFLHTNKQVFCAAVPELMGIAAQTLPLLVLSSNTAESCPPKTMQGNHRNQDLAYAFWKCKIQCKLFIAMNCHPYKKHEQTIKMLKHKEI